MANRYVRSLAAGAGTGADWTNAHTTLAAAITASTAGDAFYVSEDHAETQATALTLTFKGSNTAPDRIICVNHAGTVPPVAADLATTATVTTTSTSAITINGCFYCYGLIFNCGTGAGAANILLCAASQNAQSFENCQLNLIGTNTTSFIGLGPTSNTRGYASYLGCTVSFGNASQFMQPGVYASVLWRGKGANILNNVTVIPTSLLSGSVATPAIFSGIDLSSFGSGKTLASMNAGSPGPISFVECKLGASVTICGTIFSQGHAGIDLIGCSTTTNISRNERYRYQGTLTTETTIIRTGGASDGTTAYSWKVITSANSKADFPFETFEGAIWNTTTGSGKTLSIEIGGPAAMTNADVWLEVEYLGSSATPVASLVSSGPATPLTAGSALTSSAASWGSTPGTTYTLTSPSFTPQMVGPIRWKVKAAKASATIYIDPKPTVA